MFSPMLIKANSSDTLRVGYKMDSQMGLTLLSQGISIGLTQMQ